MIRKNRLFLVSCLLLLASGNFVKVKAHDLVNYVSLYNKESQPRNYNEIDNAATYYQKAIELYVQEPEGIKRIDIQIWPTDLEKEKFEILQEWLNQNGAALGHLIAGTEKPYLWKKMESSQNSILGILIPDLHIMRDLMYLLCCRAKIKATEGNMKGAVSDIVSAYRFGKHLTGPKTLVEQTVGLSVQGHTIKTALMIISNTDHSRETRKALHKSLLECASNLELEPDLLIMKFIGLDCLQRMYVCGENNKKRLDEKESRRQFAMLNLHAQALNMRSGAFVGKHYKSELTNIDYQQAESIIIKGLEELKQIITLEAWQINGVIIDEKSLLEKIQKSHPLLNTIVLMTVNLKISVYEQFRAQLYGFDTIMAILEFQENTGRLPDNLEELLKAGLLEKLPIDPFSGEALSYKKFDDNFSVYSYGPDFDDDCGKRRPYRWAANPQDGDLVFWPVETTAELL